MRIALAQINPTVGDLAGNARLITDAIESAADEGTDLIAFPELCVCGYPPKDLLLREGFVTACEQAAEQIARDAPRGIAIVLGTPMSASNGRRGAITNSLVVFRDGDRLARYDKRLLPTYDVFDEDRYFEPGVSPCVIELQCADSRQPALRIGLAICEDLWQGQDAGFSSRYADVPDPVDDLVRAGGRDGVGSGGVEVLLAPSASPFVLGKHRRHLEIVTRHATRHSIAVLSVNQVGANDDLVFDGRSAVVDRFGRLIAQADAFRACPLTVDLTASSVSLAGKGGVNATPSEVSGAAAASAPPSAMSCESVGTDLDDDRSLYEALVLGIRDYCRKTGFTSAIIGLSGGIDSALTAVLAAAALGPSNVIGVRMPGPYSSDHSLSDAADLAARLGIRCLTCPIGVPLAGMRAEIDPLFDANSWNTLGEHLPDLTEENLQSRLRGTILMTISNRTGAIVLTTGNKSETAVGYATLYGDMNGGLAVLSDVTKQLVYRLSRWINERHSDLGFAIAPIPRGSIEKPPSAELRPNQKDQDSLPPYDVLDEIISRSVERHQSASAIARETGFDPALVAKIVRMIDLAEYKRKQAAVGLKVTSVAFGSGRRMPIAMRWRDPL